MTQIGSPPRSEALIARLRNSATLAEVTTALTAFAIPHRVERRRLYSPLSPHQLWVPVDFAQHARPIVEAIVAKRQKLRALSSKRPPKHPPPQQPPRNRDDTNLYLPDPYQPDPHRANPRDQDPRHPDPNHPNDTDLSLAPTSNITTPTTDSLINEYYLSKHPPITDFASSDSSPGDSSGFFDFSSSFGDSGGDGGGDGGDGGGGGGGGD